jgi:hypothetical protein
MSTTLKRTSMAFDPQTLEALDELSVKWSVSKAEVMRRSIRAAAQMEHDKEPKLTPLEALMKLKNGAGISRKKAEKYMAELKKERKAWKDPWKNHDPS